MRCNHDVRRIHPPHLRTVQKQYLSQAQGSERSPLHDPSSADNLIRTYHKKQFNDAANELEDYGRKFIKEKVNSQFSDPIAKFDASIQEIRNSRNNRSTLCKKLEELQQECQSLIREIHATNIRNECS